MKSITSNIEHLSGIALRVFHSFICKQANAGKGNTYPNEKCAQFVIYVLILWRHLPSPCCLHLVPPSVVVFNVLQISFSGFLPEPFKISKNGFLHITLHTSAQNILKLQVPRSKALGGVWTESSKMSPLLYNNRLL